MGKDAGLSAFLAIIYKLSNNSNACVLFIQALMLILNSLMIFYTVKSLTKNNALGIFAALFYALDLAIYSHSLKILTDVPFSFLITLSIFLFTKYFISNKKLYAVLSIFTINYALLVRPAVMYLNIIIAAVLLIMIIFRKIDWKLPCLYLIVFTALFGGWLARNNYYHHVPFGEELYTPLRSNDFYVLYAPLTYEMAGGTQYNGEETKEYFKNLLYAKYPAFDNLSKVEQVLARKDIGQSYIMQNKIAFIKLYFWGLTKELIAPDFDTIYILPVPFIFQKILLFFSAGGLLLCYLIYAFGFLSSVKKLNYLDWIIFLSTCYLMASTAVIGYSRFRIAFYPLCVIGAFSCWKKFYGLNEK